MGFGQLFEFVDAQIEARNPKEKGVTKDPHRPKPRSRGAGAAGAGGSESNEPGVMFVDSVTPINSKSTAGGR